MTAMTLRQLAARLNSLVEANDRAGQGDRNELPVYLELKRGTRRSNSSMFIPVEAAYSGGMTFSDNEGERVTAMTLRGDEKNSVKPSRERSRKIEAKYQAKTKEGVEFHVSGSATLPHVEFTGKNKLSAAREFVNWLKKETAWDRPIGRKNSSLVLLPGADAATLKALAEEFMKA